MRMVYNVIDKMIAVIPEDRELQYKPMIHELEKIKEAALYKAPEQMPEFFQATSDVLNSYLGLPDEDWKKEIGKIFADKK